MHHSLPSHLAAVHVDVEADHAGIFGDNLFPQERQQRLGIALLVEGHPEIVAEMPLVYHQMMTLRHGVLVEDREDRTVFGDNLFAAPGPGRTGNRSQCSMLELLKNPGRVTRNANSQN